MKHVLRLSIILAVSLIGELLHALIPLPVPAGIYGIVLLFAALCLRIIPLESVAAEGHFLIDIMGVCFIPAGVGLINSWSALRPMLIPVLIALIVITFAVMGAAGRVTQAVVRSEKKKGAEK